MDFLHMATAHPPPPAGGQPPRAAASAAEAEAARQAHGLVPSPAAPEEEEDGEIRLGSPVARLPVELDVVIPVRDFRVRNLLALAPGHLIESQWSNGEDVPLAAGHVQLAWSEFEVVESQLAVRVTRLA
jgi:flagellar motor switch protein FliN/FliY